MGDGDAYVVAVDLPADVAVTESLSITREHQGEQRVVSEVRAGAKTFSLAR